ncbi:MAG: hypothetical protein A4E65_02701 [Syntrophorhabdus sp. PtaU1.Bin153]|nr:MAG: hypothetical protein A4E65_02701 [Syntrophorhabdus sp. PtaU1.Bin153]
MKRDARRDGVPGLSLLIESAVVSATCRTKHLGVTSAYYSFMQVIAATLFRSLLHCAFYPPVARSSLNFANSASSVRPQTVRIALRAVPSCPSGSQKCSKARLAKSSSCSLSRSNFYMFLVQQDACCLASSAVQTARSPESRGSAGGRYGLSCIIRVTLPGQESRFEVRDSRLREMARTFA